MNDLILPILVALCLLGALFWVLRSARVKRASRWRRPFDGVAPVQPLSTREARQAYQELKSLDKLSSNIIEEAKAEALKELQQIVEDHHKIKAGK